MTGEIHGFCDERFAPLKEAFAANFAEGLEIGASLAATEHGRYVVDLWGGDAEPDRSRPWEEDTVVELASTTKIAAALSILILVDRGQIELDERVAHYWPEFAQGDKDRVTVRQAITHRAGVPGFDPPISAATACDWEAATARLAAEPHWFGGEPRLCYHAQTYGYLIGELIRRVDGRKPRQFFREEIAAKIGADFQLGVTSEADIARMATLSIPAGAFSADGLAPKLLTSIDLTDVLTGDFDLATWWAREDPGGGGFGNGRSIARVCSIVACGGEVNGVHILSPAILAEAAKEQAYAQCPYLGWFRIGLGLALDSEEFPAPTPTTMPWGGAGGSWACMDPKTGVSVGYAPNNWIIPPPETTQFDMGEHDPRLRRIMAAMANVLPRL
jgi:CubicO group peptidase (beta-lactamase class C family)